MSRLQAQLSLEAVAGKVLELAPPSLLEARQELRLARTEEACAKRGMLRHQQLLLEGITSAVENSGELSAALPKDPAQRSEVLQQAAGAAVEKLVEALPRTSHDRITELRQRATDELNSFLEEVPDQLKRELLSAYRIKQPEDAIDLRMVVLKLLGDAEDGHHPLGGS